MERKEKIMAITEQVIGMLENNVLQENGSETFVGWLEDGEVFINNGYTEQETKEIMDLVNELAPAVDNLTFGWLHIEEI